MFSRVGCLVLISLTLVACGGPSYVPVSDRSVSSGKSYTAKSKPSAIKVPAYHIVRKGDTLYAIAWRYSLNHKTIARLNKINKNNSIFPGQKLRLKSWAKPVAKKKKSPVKSSTSARKSTKKKPATIIKSTKVIAPSSKKTAKSVNISSTRSPKKSAKVGSVSWSWPAKGRVLNGYSIKGKVNKGINIQGRLGDAVFAAANGKVVYAGNGILGYGNLVIINHNGLYMSAYAHNSRVFVNERDIVKRGDKIAEVGRSGTDRHMLHFEIRRDGKPVNPTRYLPKRR